MKSKMRIKIVLLLSLIAQHAVSQNVVPTQGKEFWLGFMLNFENDPNLDQGLKVFIASQNNTSGTLEIPQQGYSENFTVAANQITTITLPNSLVEHYLSGIVEDKGIYISSLDTIAVFAINLKEFTGDGSKVVPIQTLGTEYMIPSYEGLFGYNSELLIVATEDDTEVEITLTSPSDNGIPAGTPFTLSLDRGESYQLISTNGGDFTGSVIRGTDESGVCRPFAVFSGVRCVNIPVSCVACDHIFDQSLPVDTWGTDYFIVPFDFATGYTYRILALENNTTVTLNDGSTVVLNSGQFEEFNDVPVAHCVSADKPISVIQYMQGIDCAGLGDPAMCILNDVTQKVDNITFSTVESTIITSHSLNIVMNTSDVGSLQMNGVQVDPAEFSPFTSCPSQSFAQISIPEGVYTLQAPTGISGYVYGLGQAESYAYSVGSFSSFPFVIENVTCTSDTVTLTASPGLTDVTWFAQTEPDVILGTGIQLILTPPIIPNIYVAIGDQFQSGCTVEELFLVEVPTPPNIQVSQSATSVCQYQSVQLGVAVIPASNAFTYSWTPTTGLNNPNIANPIANPAETTTYTVLVESISGCASNVGSLTIEVTSGNIVEFDALTSDNAICQGDTVALTAAIQQSVLFDNFNAGFNASIWAGVQNGIASMNCGSGSSNSLWFNGAGERSATTVPVNVLQGGSVNFNIVIGSGAFPCDNADPGENVVLEYSTTGAAGPWTLMSTLLESAYPNFTDVSVQIPAAAQTIATTFRWRQLTNSGLNEDNWSIDNVNIGSYELDALTFTWSPNYLISATNVLNPFAYPDVTTTYSLNMTDIGTGCVYSDLVTVNVGGFSISAGADQALCDVNGAQLNASSTAVGQVNWQWSPSNAVNNSSIPNPIVTSDATILLTVTASDIFGCSNSDQILVSLLLEAVNLGPDPTPCDGEEQALTAPNGPGLSYQWSTGASSSTINVTQTGTYSVTVSSNQGCAASDQVLVTFLPTPLVEFGEIPQPCVGDIVPLNAGSTGIIYVWNTGALTQTISVTESGTYTVLVTGQNQCAAEASINLEFGTGPVINLEEEYTACEGTPLILDAGNPGSTVFWNTGALTQTLSITESGSYSVTVINDDNCIGTAETFVDIKPVPSFDLGPDTVFCEGTYISLDGGHPDQQRLWTTNSTAQTLGVTETGIYGLTVSTQFCSYYDEIEVLFESEPQNVLATSYQFCFEDCPYDLILTAGNPGYNYRWNDNSSESILTIPEPGVYNVEVTSPKGSCARIFTTEINEQCFGPNVYVPNAFSPNGDGVNDLFKAVSEVGVQSFELRVWSRWGELVWYTDDIEKGWNGSHSGSDYYTSGGVYVYSMRYKHLDGCLGKEIGVYEGSGSITVLR